MSSSDSDTVSSRIREMHIALHKKQQPTKQPVCRSTSSCQFHAVDNEKPSTSHDSHSSSRDSSSTSTSHHTCNKSGRATQHLKRKSTTDSEHYKRAKKRRLVSHDASQRELRCEDTVGNDFRGTSSEEEPQLSGTGNVYETSGLKRSLHGNVYQLKHLMLNLYRVWKMGYRFRLYTEMDTAEKFDDLVLHYRDKTGNEVHRFLQVKHKQDENKTITASQLLDMKDGEFSVLKYFISWRKIKKHSDFGGSRLKNFLLCTNIGLDVEGLEEAGIDVHEVGQPDEFLQVANRKKQPPRYKLLVEKSSQLHHTLKTASDIHQLARALAQRVRDSKEIDLKPAIFQYFHLALAKEVVDTKKKRFSDNFIRNQNLSMLAGNFRNIFIKYTKQDTWEQSKSRSLKLSSTFGKKPKSTIRSKLIPFKELPNDHINDTEISDFLNEFILAVDQPNEVELGEMIKNEIGADSQFNLLDADFIGDSFQTSILDWFKKTGSRVNFLANKDAKKFFDTIEIKLSSVITLGLSLEYPEVLKKFGIEFRKENKKLRKYLATSNCNSNQILQLISSKSFLTALRVHQSITATKRFEKNDSFIFIRLKTLVLPMIMHRVLRAFQWPRNHDLLVVDCESITADHYTEELWNPLCDIVMKNTRKRMIVITQGTNDEAIQFKIGHKTYHETDDDTSIDNLTKHSLLKLMKKTMIRFQGDEERTSFGRLLSNYNLNNTKTIEFKDLRRVIDSDTLVKIIRDEEILIGSKVQGLGEIRNYYITRTIFDHKIIKEDILKAREILDLFAISGPGTEALRKKRQRDVFRKLDILDNGAEEFQFKTLCKRNSTCNIHWLVAGTAKLIWKRSLGNITNLLAFKDMSYAASLKEDRLLDHCEHNRIVILSDIAGMGKSTILTSLAQKLKDNESSLLVMRINLIQHTTVLAEEKAHRTFSSDDTNAAVDFLVDRLSKFKTDLESLIYKMMIKDQDKAVLLFDGFDEISPTYENIVIDLLRALTKCNIKKLFVTTRPHTSQVLEAELRIFSRTLQPFSTADQIHFLIQFWTERMSKSDSDKPSKQQLKIHATSVLKLLADSINSEMKAFMGVPLQTTLVAEIYQYNRAGSREPFSEPRLPEKINTIDLYEQFVDKKYQIYCAHKKSSDNTKPGEAKDGREMRKIFLIMHKKLALDALFDDNTIELLLNSQPEVVALYEFFRDENVGEELTGIITRVIDGKPQFVHLTFAEYFAALFLINTLKDDRRNQRVRNFFLGELFVQSQYKTIRAFLDCLLSGDTYAVENKSWKLDLDQNCNADRETVYHVAAREGNINIVKFFLNRLIEHREDQTVYNSTSAGYGNLKQPESPVENGEQERNSSNIDLQDKFGRTPLLIAVDNADKYYSYSGIFMKGEYIDVLKCFVEGGANVNCTSLNGETPLHVAAAKRNDLLLDGVKYLIDNMADVNLRDQNGCSPLWVAAATGSTCIIECLIANGANVRAQDRYGWTLACL